MRLCAYSLIVYRWYRASVCKFTFKKCGYVWVSDIERFQFCCIKKFFVDRASSRRRRRLASKQSSSRCDLKKFDIQGWERERERERETMRKTAREADCSSLSLLSGDFITLSYPLSLFHTHPHSLFNSTLSQCLARSQNLPSKGLNLLTHYLTTCRFETTLSILEGKREE